jgi:hypothetical protein
MSGGDDLVLGDQGTSAESILFGRVGAVGGENSNLPGEFIDGGFRSTNDLRAQGVDAY